MGIGHRNENHPSEPNSCFGYTKQPGTNTQAVINNGPDFVNDYIKKKLVDVNLDNDTDNVHHSACLNGANLNELCDDGTSVMSKIGSFIFLNPTLKQQNNKVSLIEGKMNDTNITYLKYTYYDGTSVVASGNSDSETVEKLGIYYIGTESSTDQEFAYVIKDNTFIVHIKEVLWEGGTLGSGLIITTIDDDENINNISIMPA